MKTLVTGGCGFIGSHVVDRLLADGHSVTVIDNLSTGRAENLAHHRGCDRLTVVNKNIADARSIEQHFAGIDWVFHLAALADIVPSIQHPMAYHASNVDGTIAVLEACRAHSIKRLLYAASSSCYGLADIVPTPETAPIRPMYPYALTKTVGEQYVMHWNNVYGIPAVSLRFFNVYGPRARTSGTYGAVFGVFLAQKLNKKPFTVVGDGSQTRDFTFVTDVAHACVSAAQSDLRGEIMNVGSGGTYSINELVQRLGGDVTYVPKRPGEPDCTFADTTKIATLLGWKARVPFSEGVKIMLSHLEEWRTAPVWTPDSIAIASKEWHEHLGRER